MTRPRDWFYLTILILAAVLLRAPLVHTGITIDDACSAYVAEAGSWADLVERVKTVEMSPPLYFVVLRGIVGIFGLTTPVLAVTSLIFSVVTVPLVYLLGRASMPDLAPDQTQVQEPDHTQDQPPDLASRVGLCAAFFATTSLLSIIYSHEARTYALAGLLITLALLLFVPFFDGRAGLKRQLGLFIAATLLAYTHYTAIAYIGIMILIAGIYGNRGPSMSLSAIPPLVAGLSTLIPWYPILKYHGTVGTPWSDSTPLTHFPAVLASNISAVSPLPVVPSYLILTLIMPAVVGLYIAIRPKECAGQIRQLCLQPKLLTLAVLFFYSASVIGFITPYIFGYVRYMYPIAATAWVLLAVALVKLATRLGEIKAIKSASKSTKICLVSLLALIPVALSICEVAAIAAHDRSGLRRLAAEISAGRFGKAAYITSPDFVGIILVYYLKHECGLTAGQLPTIIGFACPDSGLLPPKHDGRAAYWQDPQLVSKYEERLKELKQKGAGQIILVRDTYTPTSEQMPTQAMTDKLEKMLTSKLVPSGPAQTYTGHASTYQVTRFAFPSPAGKQ